MAFVACDWRASVNSPHPAESGRQATRGAGLPRHARVNCKCRHDPLLAILRILAGLQYPRAAVACIVDVPSLMVSLRASRVNLSDKMK